MGQAYTISYCVNSVLADRNETSKVHYQKFLHYGIQGFRRLNLGNVVDTSIKTAKLEIDHNTNTAQLPDDYVNYLKIGYSCHGVIINLDLSTDLRFQLSNDIFPSACDCESELNQCQDAAQMGGTLSGDVTAYPFFNTYWYYATHFHNGQVTAGWYGYGAGRYRNSFRINKEKWQVQFDSYIKGDFVIMEYQSTGIDNGDAYIDETLIPAITAYIHWQAALHDTTKNRLEAQMFERIWKQELRGVVARQAALDSWTWIQTWRKSIQATPKR